MKTTCAHNDMSSESVIYIITMGPENTDNMPLKLKQRYGIDAPRQNSVPVITYICVLTCFSFSPYIAEEHCTHLDEVSSM